MFFRKREKILSPEVKAAIDKLRGKSREELEQIVEQGKKEQVTWLIEKWLAISEAERRLHEINFHDRDEGTGAVEEYEKAIGLGYKQITQWLYENI